MELTDRVCVVTGGASGIGRALCERLAAAGARHVVVADRDAEGAKAVAAGISGTPAALDVSDESAIRSLVADTEKTHGRVDLFVSNAGYVTIGGLEIENAELENMFAVHVMAHLYAARAAVPGMIARGEGYLLNTASAAGLLAQIGSLAYTVTKHAAVSLAEWLSITHGHQGIGVSVLCPQAVATNIGQNSPSRALRGGHDEPGTMGGVASGDGVLGSEQVADECLDAIRAGRFWVLPHKEVAEYVQRKAGDVDRWLAGMRRWQGRMFPPGNTPGDWFLR